MALLWGLLAGFTFGVGDLLIRLGVRHGTPFTGAVVSSVTISLFFAVLLGVRGLGDGPLWPATGWFLLMGVAASGPARILFYYSMRRVGVSRATVLITVGPLFGLVYAVTFLGERPSWHAILGALIVVVGVASVLADRAGIRLTPRATWLGLLPALFMGGTLVFIRLGMRALSDPIFGSFLSSSGALLFLLAMQRCVSRGDRWGAERRGWKYFLMAGLAYCGAFYTYHQALGAAEISFVAPLIFTSPLFSILIARLFVQEIERVTWRLALGAVVVFGGIYLVSISKGG